MGDVDPLKPRNTVLRISVTIIFLIEPTLICICNIKKYYLIILIFIFNISNIFKYILVYKEIKTRAVIKSQPSPIWYKCYVSEDWRGNIMYSISAELLASYKQNISLMYFLPCTTFSYILCNVGVAMLEQQVNTNNTTHLLLYILSNVGVAMLEQQVNTNNTTHLLLYILSNVGVAML